MHNVKLTLTFDVVRTATKRLVSTGVYPSNHVTRVAQSGLTVDADIPHSLSFNIHN